MKKIIKISLFISLVFIGFACEKTDLDKGWVNYVVFGTNSDNYVIRYAVNGDMVFDTVKTGWSYDFVAEPGTDLYLRATSQSVDSEVFVRIFYEGVLVAADSAAGDSVEVDCMYDGL